MDGELATASQHNDPLEDLQTDANTVRPVVAGGTGSSTAATATTALSAVSYGSAQTLTAAQQAVARTNISAALSGQLWGLTLSNNVADATNDIDIAVGEAASTETNPVLMKLAAILTKRLDASWSVGTNQGGLDTGSIANATYHVWLIQRSDTGVVDALFSTSETSPTMPTNYDRKRRIGAIVRTGGVIKPFLQDGDMFWWASPPRDTVVTNPGTSAVLSTLTVPTSIKVIAEIVVNTGGGGACAHFALFTSPDVADNAASATNYNHSGFTLANQVNSNRLAVRTDTSRRIRGRISASTAADQYEIVTNGWTDTRGRIT